MWARSLILMCGVAAVPYNRHVMLNEIGGEILNATVGRDFHDVVLNEISGEILNATVDLDFHETNPTTTRYGRLVEGDILHTPEQDRKGVTSKELWDNRQYNYQISSGAIRDSAEAAIQFWRDHTCIDFKEVSDSSTVPRVKFVLERGCWSNVGCVAKHQRSRTQQLSLGTGCGRLGTATHEIGHSLGFYHEQSRSDRDQYIAIQWANLKSKARHNFRKVDSTVHHGVPYDLTSVMHYGTTFFSANRKPTILTLDPTKQPLIGQRIQPSFRDISLMNRMYKCEELCPRQPTCLNGGYVSADCTCHCPPNTSGASCDVITGSFYPEPSCGGKVTSEGSIVSPSWPGVYPAGSDCIWWITPPAGTTAQVTFTKFDILYRINGKCTLDYMDVHVNGSLGEGGEKSCAQELEGRSAISTSADGSIILHFSAYREHYGGTGFSANVKFI